MLLDDLIRAEREPLLAKVGDSHQNDERKPLLRVNVTKSDSSHNQREEEHIKHVPNEQSFGGVLKKRERLSLRIQMIGVLRPRRHKDLGLMGQYLRYKDQQRDLVANQVQKALIHDVKQAKGLDCNQLEEVNLESGHYANQQVSDTKADLETLSLTFELLINGFLL